MMFGVKKFKVFDSVPKGIQPLPKPAVKLQEPFVLLGKILKSIQV